MHPIKLTLTAICACSALVFAGKRENMGIYGGTVFNYAYDQVHGKLFASIAGPLSCFTSDDSGATWRASFPEDSLEIMGPPPAIGQPPAQPRGWAGRAFQVVSDGGITVVVTSEEGGTLQSSVITTDGEKWRTCLDQQLSSKAAQQYQNTTQKHVSSGNPTCAAVKNGTVLVGIRNIIWVSKDTAKTWKPIPYPDSSALDLLGDKAPLIYGIYPLPNDTSGKSFYIIVSDSGFNSQSRSLHLTTNGKTFTKINVTDTEKKAVELNAMKNLWINELHPDTMIINVHTYGPPVRITNFYRTYDGGATWTRINPDPTSGIPVDEMVYIAQDDSLPGIDHVLLMSGKAYSDDLGTTWKSLKNDNIRTLLFHIPNSKIYLANQENNPMRSDSGLAGPYTMNSQGLEAVTITQIAQRKDAIGRVYLATRSGLGFTTRFGDTTISNSQRWAPPYGNFPIIPNNEIGFSSVCISPYDSLLVLAGSGNGILRTTNGGMKDVDWTSISYNQFGASNADGGAIVSFAFYSADTVFAGLGSNVSGALYKSVDKGASWQAVSSFPKDRVNSIAIAAKDSNKVIYVAAGASGKQGTLYRSSNGGVTWDSTAGPNSTTGQKTRVRVRDVVVKPGQTDTLFLACGDNLDCAAAYSIDGGATIKTIKNAFMGGAEMTSIAISRTNPDSVFIGMRREINVVDFKADTPMVKPYFRGLPGEIIYDVFYDDLVMGSSVGFFSVNASSMIPTPVMKPASTKSATKGWLTSSIIGNRLNIKYSLVKSSLVRIELISLTGRLMYRADLGKIEKGFQSTSIDMTGLDRNGVYTIRLISDNEKMVKPVLRLK